MKIVFIIAFFYHISSFAQIDTTKQNKIISIGNSFGGDDEEYLQMTTDYGDTCSSITIETNKQLYEDMAKSGNCWCYIKTASFVILEREMKNKIFPIQIEKKFNYNFYIEGKEEIKGKGAITRVIELKDCMGTASVKYYKNGRIIISEEYAAADSMTWDDGMTVNPDTYQEIIKSSPSYYPLATGIWKYWNEKGHLFLEQEFEKGKLMRQKIYGK